MKERRDRKEMRADQQRHYEGLEELPVSEKAKERFRRPAYQAQWDDPGAGPADGADVCR